MRRRKESPPLPPEATQNKTVRLVTGRVFPSPPRPRAPLLPGLSTSRLPGRPPDPRRGLARPLPPRFPRHRQPEPTHTPQSRPRRNLSLGRRASSPRRRSPTLARPRFQGRHGARAPAPPSGTRPARKPYLSRPLPGALRRAPELSGRHHRLPAQTGYTDW